MAPSDLQAAKGAPSTSPQRGSECREVTPPPASELAQDERVQVLAGCRLLQAEGVQTYGNNWPGSLAWKHSRPLNYLAGIITEPRWCVVCDSLRAKPCRGIAIPSIESRWCGDVISQSMRFDDGGPEGS